MKKITEKELMESVRALRDYTEVAEATQPNRDFSAANIGKAAGNIWQGVKNTAGAVGNTVSNAASSVGNAVGGAANAVGGAANAVGNAASDVATGFNSAQQPGAAAQTAPSKWPTTPQAIVAFQQANGLKADGIIGQQTIQALSKQGISPPTGFQMAGAKQQVAQDPTDQPDFSADWDKYQADMAALKGNQPVQETVDPEMSRFRNIFSEDTNLQEIKDTSTITFQQENSLARIVQLSRK